MTPPTDLCLQKNRPLSPVTPSPEICPGDPLFVNVTNLPTGLTGAYAVDMAPDDDGFRLQQNSPGIGRGIVLPGGFGGTINFVSRPTRGEWDIGAYEREPGVSGVSVPRDNLRIWQGIRR